MSLCKSAVAFGVAVFVLGLSTAIAQQKPVAPVKRFFSVLDLKQPGIETVLIGAREAKSADFPASFYAVSAGGSCTSALVASRALLLAAHCMENGQTVAVNLRGNTYEGTCTHAPEYAGNHTADWALCALTRAVTGIPFEKVNVDDARLTIGSELLLTGFGCIKPGGGGGNDGIYRIGEASVSSLPLGASNDIVTVASTALCYGDSGGPAFFFLDVNKRDRVIVSVNSRGNIEDTSYLSSTSTKVAKRFFENWSKANGVRICGIHADAAECRVP